MACNSDYMAPHAQETRIHETAMLLRWALVTLGRRVPPGVERAATDIYGGGRGSGQPDPTIVPALCALLTELDDAAREALIYGQPKVREARQLADWWEEHQAADATRLAHEDAERRRVAAIASGMSKLTPEERAALGVRRR